MGSEGRGRIRLKVDWEGLGLLGGVGIGSGRGRGVLLHGGGVGSDFAWKGYRVSSRKEVGRMRLSLFEVKWPPSTPSANETSRSWR